MTNTKEQIKCPECECSDLAKIICHVGYVCRACGYEWREGELEITEQEET